MGNLLLSRLVQTIFKTVDNELAFDKIICFTDSQVSLSWLIAEEKELITFVQNRLIEIRQNVKPENWFYCRTNENPAGLVTKIEGEVVQNTIWWEGADFLKSTKIYVTKYSLPEHLVHFEKEGRIIETMMFRTTELENIIDIHKYSDLLRSYRITALRDISTPPPHPPHPLRESYTNLNLYKVPRITSLQRMARAPGSFSWKM